MRSNRYQPTALERLEQSRVARGELSEAPLPPPRPARQIFRTDTTAVDTFVINRRPMGWTNINLAPEIVPPQRTDAATLTIDEAATAENMNNAMFQLRQSFLTAFGEFDNNELTITKRPANFPLGNRWKDQATFRTEYERAFWEKTGSSFWDRRPTDYTEHTFYRFVKSLGLNMNRVFLIRNTYSRFPKNHVNWSRHPDAQKFLYAESFCLPIFLERLGPQTRRLYSFLTEM